jgi:hypothetical protein
LCIVHYKFIAFTAQTRRKFVLPRPHSVHWSTRSLYKATRTRRVPKKTLKTA